MLFTGVPANIMALAGLVFAFIMTCLLTYRGAELAQMQTTYAAMFHAGWFVESMWTQTLVIHMLRTEKLPFAQSRASVPVALLSLAGIALVTAIPFTPLAAPLEMAALPPVYFLLLGMVVLGYMALVTVVKKRYIRRYGQWL